ncbi:hypothetical protein NC661_10590 [Aquibacillus koreensis]|uniref:Lipoprotein n=1 Tax=Aquibacillus koreensis TaxID=279446 RepID=A0A9X3WMB0_9BACI|nr:hypothetical protein [Aquibacillus koreensis]MCT2538240.1 hypothetical protein [Aquibacillus koreensis]MDC3420816.1 hypothetical protein [Aquibacillus koreensis]
MRQYYRSIVMIICVLISVGCSSQESKSPTISINAESEYVNTFEKLDLGLIFDFDFHLPNADQTWVTLWVEKYSEGKKDTEPVAILSYGNSPSEVEEGLLGFGMLNQNTDDTAIFLYGPGVSIEPRNIDLLPESNLMSSWDYALQDDEKLELQLGETKILASYRETQGNGMSTISLSSEEEVEKLIQDNDLVLLLKIKVEERLAD